MVRQKCITLDSPSEWRESLKGIEHSFAHTWESCYAMQLTTGSYTYLYSFEGDNVRIVCPISERRFEDYVDIVTPYGFSGFVGSGDCSKFSCYWTDFVKQRDYICGYIGLNPLFENNTYFESMKIERYNEVYILDLTLSQDRLFKNLSTNRKRQLRDWDNSLSYIVLEKSILMDFFLANYLTFFRRKNAVQTYSLSKETLSFLLDSNNVLIVGAQDSGEVKAVTVFAYTPYVGDFLFNVSLPEGQDHSVALLWYGVNYLKSLQVPLLNLGGGIRANDGVAKFKQRFGGKRMALGCLKQVYEPKVYDELCRQVNADATDTSGYFPAYRSP